ncbi:MAG: type II toxin-antitoxin system HigB family toxin [Geovibrio sp.]|nr:type II toxin-antitoxin system HigB family toxin [Geovibrio sp.]MCD8568363.1 type II toxin-antitoxin system HigB family toxin [Geovibrio sp.]
MIVKIHYTVGLVYIRFIGTHKEYDKINAAEV